MIAHGTIRRAPASASLRPCRTGTDRPRAKGPRGDHDHSEQDASNGLIDARDSKGAHTHDDEIEKRECAKEDVTDTSGGPVHFCFPFTALWTAQRIVGRTR